MSKLTLTLGSKAIELQIQECRSANDLAKLFQSALQTKEEVLGVTDLGGKFYDLEYTCRNIKTFNNHKLKLITGRESIENVSFGSRASKRNDYLKDKKEKCQGKINDLPTFRRYLPKGISIILTLKQNDKVGKISFDYYIATGTSRWMELWNNGVLIVECEIGDNYQAFFEAIAIYLQRYIADNSRPQCPDPQQIMNNEAKKTMILQAFEQLFEEGALSELEFYKKKILLLEKPHYYTHRFFTGETIDRSELIERIRMDFSRQKQEVKKFQIISNSPQKKDIPILVRKDSNNMIKKVSTEHPLSLEQQQILNLLLQLQLKGLITQKQMQIYQQRALNLDDYLMSQVRQYYESQFDQIQLALRLRKLLRSKRQEKKLIQ